VSGSMKYIEKDLGDDVIHEILCVPGMMIFTAPNKVHRTEFITDTVLLSLGKEPKNHEAHENDVVRIEW